MVSRDEEITNKINHNYKLVSINDNADLKDAYESEKKGHTEFYNENDKKFKEHGAKLRELFEEEYSFGRSRFAKKLKGLDKQTSSGISQILKKIEDSSSQTSDAVYANAIDDQTMKEKFKDAITTQDPLSLDQKLRIHEAIMADGAVGRAVSFWRKFLMGKDINVDFMIKKELDPILSDAIDERLQLHPDITKYKNKLREIDEEVELRKAVQSICDNLFGYGRAVLVLLFNEEKIPIRLVPLSSLKLGRVYMDKNTFEFLGVEYLEIPDKKNILLATDMIYFTLNDNNVTPNSRYYGKSQIFSVLSIAENNLINRERNFPEIIRRRWAATLLIKTSTRSSVRNQQIADEVNSRAGGSVVIPDLVSAENIKMETELNSLIEYSKEMDKKIFRDMELPTTSGGFDISSSTGGTTTAQAQAELQMWSESTLEDLRELVTDTLVKQWYSRNLRKIIEDDVIANGVETKFTPPPVFDPEQAQLDLEKDQQEEQAKKTKPPLSPAEDEEEEDKKPAEDVEEENATTKPPIEDEEEGEVTTAPTETNDKIMNKKKITPDKELSLFEKLGFDIVAFDEAMSKDEAPDEATLEKWVLEKLTNIAKDIYKDIVEVTIDDVISLTREVKFPFKIYLKFVNINLDTFLDRAAGVLGILSGGVINNDIALELMRLEKYIPVMRREAMKKERLKIEQMRGKLANQAKQINDLGGNPNAAINGQQPAQFESEDPEQQEKEAEEEAAKKNVSNPTNLNTAVKNKVSGRIAQRTNRGRVG
jgi:hypothetical protein